MTHSLTLSIGMLLLVTTVVAAAEPPNVLLRIQNAPPDGLVIARVDLTWATKDLPSFKGGIAATNLADSAHVPIQFVPDDGFDAQQHATGAIIARVPHEGEWNLRLSFDAAPTTKADAGDVTLRTKHYAIRFAKDRQNGLPSLIEFPESGKRFDSFVWNDRLYDPEAGQFWLRYDPEAKAEVVSQGTVCTVVGYRARYCQADGKQPPQQPRAIYDWYIFPHSPLVYVTATVRQKEPYIWNELHVLEVNFPDESFRQWAGGEPLKKGDFTGSKQGFTQPGWGALIDGPNALGMFGNDVKFYDGCGEYGTYLNSIWQQFHDTECRVAAWLWIGAAPDPAAAVQAASRRLTPRATAIVTRQDLHDRIEALRKENATDARRFWQAELAARAESLGRLDDARRFVEGKLPEGWVRSAAGDLGLAIEKTKSGVRVSSLFDLHAHREILASRDLPLFILRLRQLPTKEKAELVADAGWQDVDVSSHGKGITITWQKPAEPRLKGICVTATARPDTKSHAWRWQLDVANPASEWTLDDVTFPQIAVAELGSNTAVLFPGGPGQLKRDVWSKDFSYRSRYPNGWCSMQFMAVYDEQPAVGFYFGGHDPFGSTKEIIIESEPSSRSVRLAFEIPAPDMGVAGNAFALSGEAVWQLFRGDWFDAALIYKAWVRKHAQWWPRLGRDGREDTPRWMRELCAWAQTGGAPGECVAGVKEFAQQLDVPAGFHWYNWHQIPFDNDYPHYFPPKDGFAEAVRDLQDAHVFVMPYINGRLWDTRDKGMEDFEFTRVALPAVTKDENGKPYTEKYGSKEADGSPVVLGVMCPTTPLWQRTVKDIVLRLHNEMGVKGVYIDQIAAAAPALCMDRAHGHPLGGGHWWNEGYWQLLQDIRDAKAPDRMITTECNAEPFVHRLDGYLTWHWQNDGQVPAFPAVYGGAVQMFGRSYGGGATRDLALRMKAGQQLVFGEQIGWLDPELLQEDDNLAFLRHAVRLRWHLRRYFYAGEMARPPKLSGEVPTVKADWQWSGEWWVTTDAVLTGAWQLPKQHTLVLLFANVSDNPVTAELSFDGRAYDLTPTSLHVDVLREKEGVAEQFTVPNRFQRTITFPARSLFAWEIR